MRATAASATKTKPIPEWPLVVWIENSTEVVEAIIRGDIELGFVEGPEEEVRGSLSYRRNDRPPGRQEKFDHRRTSKNPAKQRFSALSQHPITNIIGASKTG